MANGLLNLQTDLKSLRYGSDRPYITKDINNPPSSNQIGMQASKRIDDTSRIVQMLVNKPGLKYLANEALLQQVDAGDKIAKAQKKGKSLVGAIIQQVGGTFVSTLKIAGSTLAQVPVNGTGTHFLKGFRTDTYLQPTGGDKIGAFAAFFGAGGIEGAPYALKGEIVPGAVGISNQNFGETSKDGKTFKATTPSKYDYDGATTIKYIGKAYEPSDEKVNEAIPKKSEARETKANAQNGASIPVGSIKPISFTKNTTTDFRDLSPTKIRGVETTVTPGTPIYQSSISSISNIVSEKSGYISPDSIKNVASASYSQDSTFTKTSTKTSIINAQTGAPIPVYTSGSGLRESSTTAWLTGEQDNSNNGTQNFSSGSTYAGVITEDTIAKALSGNPIIIKQISGSYRSQRVAQGYGASYQPFADPKPISEITEQDETTGPSTEVLDFRSGSDSVYSYNYSSATVNREQRVNLGSQGRYKNKSSYMVVDPLAIDKLNASPESSTSLDGVHAGRDFAKFYFEIITPDNPTGTFLHFRAFIDSIDDGYTADWQAHKYNGRAENFYTYGGFDRDISVSFNIAAASRSEMKPLYRKMVYLASATAPTYGASGLMRGTLAKLTIGSYFTQIPGVITSVKYSVDNNSPWEIAMSNPEAGVDDDVQELPMVLKCSISFKPIHDFAPQTGLYHYFTSPNSKNGSKSFL